MENPLLQNKSKPNPFLATNPGPNPFLATNPGPNPFLQTPKTTIGMTKYVAPSPTIIQSPVTQPTVNTPTAQSPLYVNGITSDPAEMQKNRDNLALSIANLKPVTNTNFNLSSDTPTINSNLISTSKTREDVINLVNKKQAELASGTNQNLQPTSGYKKFLEDYSSKVQYSPEQQQALVGMNKTASDIADIQRNLKNKELELSQQGTLSPAQVRAEMAQYSKEADSRIADLLSSQRDYTLNFNALEAQRKNTLDAYGIQAPFYKPQEVSPGAQVIDPSTGQVIGQGGGVAPSTAISYANQLYQNDLTSGQPKLTPDGQVDSAYYFAQAQQQLSSGTGNFGGGSSVIQNTQNQPSQQVPPSIQSATRYIDNKPYIDASGLNSNQLPIAQAYSARTGVPLLSEKDATKLKDANATFNATDSLLGTIQQLSDKLITATGPTGIPLQYAKTTIGSILKTNPDAVVFDSSVKAFSSLLTRAAGEKGTLTDVDVSRIISALPTKTDTIDSAAKKAQTLMSLYSSIKQGTIDTYLGGTGNKTANVVQTKAGSINTNW